MQARSFLFLLLAASAIPLRAQTELSAFSSAGRAAAITFVTDYQSVGINPANLGWRTRYKGKHLTLGLAESSVSLHSDALSRDDMRKRLLNSDFRFTPEQKDEAARLFANSGARARVDLMAMGIALSTEQAGGFAFQMRDRISTDARFSPRTADLFFRGFGSNYFDLLVLATGDTITNYEGMSPDSLAMVILGVATQPQAIGRLTNGSHVRSMWYREYAFSYGRHLLRSDDLELHAGIGMKYLSGIGIIDITGSGDHLAGFHALSDDFDIDYQAARRRSDARITAGKLLFPRAVGSGFGIDLGLSTLIQRTWKIGASVVDIGSITWTGNAYTANNGSLVELASAGLENYDLINGFEDLALHSGLFDWRVSSSRKVALPTQMRLGAGRLFGEKLELGADLVVPLNEAPGNLEQPLFALGGDIRPARWVQFSTGLQVGGGTTTKVPVGITFIAGNGTWEAGVASRDVITYFTDNDPTISLALGFLRFRF